MDAYSPERIDHVTVNVTDVDRAKRFYGGLLRLSEVPRPESFKFPGCWYQVGGALLHVVGRSGAPPDGTHHFCLWVGDVHAAARATEKAGVSLTWETKNPIPGIDRFFTADPDGNRIEIQGPGKG